jgi:transcriptional regulator with XRE-family HTH domain
VLKSIDEPSTQLVVNPSLKIVMENVAGHKKSLLRDAVMAAYKAELGCTTQADVAKALGISKSALTQRFSSDSVPSQESLRSFLTPISSESLRAAITDAWSADSGTSLNVAPKAESGTQPGVAAKRLAEQGEHSLSLAEALEEARSGKGGVNNFTIWVRACEGAFRLDRFGTAMAVVSEFLERSKEKKDVACQALAMAMAARAARRAGENYSVIKSLADDALSLLESIPPSVRAKSDPARYATGFIDSEVCHALLELSDRQPLLEAQITNLRRIVSKRSAEARTPEMQMRAAVLEAWVCVASGELDRALVVKAEAEARLGHSRELLPIEARVKERLGRIDEAIHIFEDLSIECEAAGDMVMLLHAQRQLVRLRLKCNRVAGELRLGPPSEKQE